MREGRNSATRQVDGQEICELQEKLMHVSGLTGMYYPLDATDNYPVAEFSNTNQLPVPPQSLWHGYGANKDEYLAGGKLHAAIFNDTYEKYSPPLEEGQKILDFGCSAGRIIRFFENAAKQGVEVWGCDIDSASIDWCQKNLLPPFKFFINTTTPYLPFPDNYFNMIYAGSVFSHINEMTSAWLLELARVTAPGGICVYTIHSEKTIEYISSFESQSDHKLSKTARVLKSWGLSSDILQKRGNMCFESSAWWLSAWYSVEYFSRLASMGYEVVDSLPELYGYQTGIVLRGI